MTVEEVGPPLSPYHIVCRWDGGSDAVGLFAPHELEHLNEGGRGGP
jgi:hypothetical protein